QRHQARHQKNGISIPKPHKNASHAFLAPKAHQRYTETAAFAATSSGVSNPRLAQYIHANLGRPRAMRAHRPVQEFAE
ncbi:MAG TPA: hypothetical protein VMU19_10775, partial [Bryobacteraceae bacterium]|nr:hypothetical protein [Bryobacteraceae bacterium]